MMTTIVKTRDMVDPPFVSDCLNATGEQQDDDDEDYQSQTAAGK